MSQLKQVAVSRLATQKAVEALAAADLFAPLEMTVNNTRLNGLYYMDEKSCGLCRRNSSNPCWTAVP